MTFFIFSSAKIFQKYLQWENPGTGKSEKHVFCPSPKRHFFHFFPVPRFFKKISSGKIPALEKVKNTFFARNIYAPVGILQIPALWYRESDFRMRFLPVSLQCGNGYLYYTGSLNKKTGIPSGDPYRNFCQKLVTPTGFFLLGRATFYYHGSPPRGGRFTSRPTAYVGPALPALEDACSLVFPLIFECHFIFCFS